MARLGALHPRTPWSYPLRRTPKRHKGQLEWIDFGGSRRTSPSTPTSRAVDTAGGMPGDLPLAWHPQTSTRWKDHEGASPLCSNRAPRAASTAATSARPNDFRLPLSS
jgi:hypothetical protein